MGKSQKKRGARRHNPMRVPDSHLQPGLAAAASSSSKRDSVVPILEKLSSPDAQDRVWACAAVSNLIQNDPSTRRLLQGKNVVGTLIAKLSDTVEEVVVEAAGALRNLCIDGGHEICAEMFNKGLFPVLKSFVPKISSVLAQLLVNPKAAPENATRLAYEFAENVITIFWCLSETSNKALNAVNQANLIPFLMAFLDSRAKLPLSTVNAAGQCLYVLTEDNDPAIDELRMNAGYVSCLLSIVQSGVERDTDDRVTTLRTLACAILQNIWPLPPMIPSASIDLERTVLLPFLTPLLAIDLTEISKSVEDALSTQGGEPKQKIVAGAKTDHKTPSELHLEKLETQLRTVQLALEVLTALCAQLPDPDLVEGEEDDGDAEEEWEEENTDEEMDADVTPQPDTAPTNIVKKIQSVDYLTALVPPITALTKPTHLSYPPAFTTSPHPPTTSALGAIHLAALECLNNIFLSLAAAIDEGGSEEQTKQKIMNLAAIVWNEIWSMLASVGKPEGTGPGPERKKEVWFAALGALWGVARICRGHLVPVEEQVQLLMEICSTVPDDTSKVQAIGILECLAVHPASIEANKVISLYLLSFLSQSNTPTTNGIAPNPNAPSTHPEPIIQAIYSIIDIFSDESAPWDINFRQGRWETVLAQSRPSVRKLVKSIDKRKEEGRELRARGEEVLVNLEAFVKYRRKLKL